MAQLTYTLTTADLIAAIQAWVATKNHVMDATKIPVFTGDGGVTVFLNS